MDNGHQSIKTSLTVIIADLLTIEDRRGNRHFEDVVFTPAEITPKVRRWTAREYPHNPPPSKSQVREALRVLESRGILFRRGKWRKLHPEGGFEKAVSYTVRPPRPGPKTTNRGKPQKRGELHQQFKPHRTQKATDERHFHAQATTLNSTTHIKKRGELPINTPCNPPLPLSNSDVVETTKQLTTFEKGIIIERHATRTRAAHIDPGTFEARLYFDEGYPGTIEPRNATTWTIAHPNYRATVHKYTDPSGTEAYKATFYPPTGKRYMDPGTAQAIFDDWQDTTKGEILLDFAYEHAAIKASDLLGFEIVGRNLRVGIDKSSGREDIEFMGSRHHTDRAINNTIAALAAGVITTDFQADIEDIAAKAARKAIEAERTGSMYR